MEFHFHWGSVDQLEFNQPTGGSEHTINGFKYFSEIHLEHWKAEYESFETALTKPDGLAVLGYFIEIV